MSFFKRVIVGSVAAAVLSSSTLAGAAIRPSLPDSSVGTRVGTSLDNGARVGSPVQRASNLRGSPLFLYFLGAVVITIGTIIIINHHDHPASRG